MTTQPDYWCNRGLAITVQGPDSRQRIEIDKPFARLGSHDLSEVLIPDKGVARRKLYFHATDDGVFFVDLTRVASATSRPRGWLSPDDCIKLGPYRVWAELIPPAAGQGGPRGETPADLEANGTAAEPQPVLIMSVKGKEIARRDLTRQLTVIGRRSPSTLRVISRSVSATHCVLYWESGVLWVVDLLSGNGTRLQGQRIEVAQFPPAASLKIGRAEFRHGDMFEKLPDGDEIEPARISDSDDRERSERLAAERAEFDEKTALWEETRQRQEAELAAGKNQLDEMTTALEIEKEEVARLRQQEEEARQRQEAEAAAGKSQLEEMTAALEIEKEELAKLRQREEETRQRQEAELAARKSQLEEMAAALEIEKEELTTLRHREEEDETSRRQPAHDPPSAQSTPAEPETPSLPRPLATPSTIRPGPRWTPTSHTEGLRPLVTAFWAWVMVLVVLCSAIAGTAVWFHLTPAYTVSIQTGAAIYGNTITELDDAGDNGSPEDIIRSDEVLIAVITKVDDATLLEMSSSGDGSTWLRDALEVDYSSDTNIVRIGLSGTRVSDLSAIVDTVAEAFVAKLSLPSSAIVDRRSVDGGNRLLLTILSTVPGLLVPVLLAAMWCKRWLAARSEFMRRLG